MAKQKQQRSILILVRYTIKKDYAPKGLHTGDVVLLVRNDRGKEYYVSLRRNKAHSCTCTGNAEYGRKCYHIKDLVQVENARYAAHKAAKATQQVVEPVEQPVVSPEPARATFWCKNKHCRCYLDNREPVDPVAYAEKIAAQVKEYEREMLEGSLNGNRSFELLMVS